MSLCIATFCVAMLADVKEKKKHLCDGKSCEYGLLKMGLG